MSTEMQCRVILFRLRIGCPWHDLPEKFGCWDTVCSEFNLWPKKAVLIRLFNSRFKEPDMK
ncbi:MAG: transposase [Gammaproteobacteria bacterium]|nr:transposase [Gammaproteobacteria bacterium]